MQTIKNVTYLFSPKRGFNFRSCPAGSIGVAYKTLPHNWNMEDQLVDSAELLHEYSRSASGGMVTTRTRRRWHPSIPRPQIVGRQGYYSIASTTQELFESFGAATQTYQGRFRHSVCSSGAASRQQPCLTRHKAARIDVSFIGSDRMQRPRSRFVSSRR